MSVAKERYLLRVRRKRRVRGKVSGTAERPRLTVFRSNKNIYAQLIDDIQGRTLASASTRDKAVDCVDFGGNIASAVRVGELIGAKAVGAGIKKVVFDRNGYKYHGRVKSLADAARSAGLEF